MSGRVILRRSATFAVRMSSMGRADLLATWTERWWLKQGELRWSGCGQSRKAGRPAGPPIVDVLRRS
jgi:hypothetical protein